MRLYSGITLALAAVLCSCLVQFVTCCPSQTTFQSGSLALQPVVVCNATSKGGCYRGGSPIVTPMFAVLRHANISSGLAGQEERAFNSWKCLFELGVFTGVGQVLAAVLHSMHVYLEQS